MKWVKPVSYTYPAACGLHNILLGTLGTVNYLVELENVVISSRCKNFFWYSNKQNYSDAGAGEVGAN